MTALAADDPGGMAAVAATELPGATRRRILLYLAGLFVLMGFANPSGGLIGLPISFFLKNKLHLAAHEVAFFSLCAHMPVYFAFAFGFARDTWNLFGKGDRGFLMLFGALGASACLVFAYTPPTYGALLAAGLILQTAFLFTSSALRGLASTIGRQHVMSGRVSAAWSLFAALPALTAAVLGGLLSQAMEGEKAALGARTLFLVVAAVMGCVAAYGLLKPASVFGNVRAERAPGARRLDDFRRLLRHRPIYPALLIFLLWEFLPGFGTPLQYYLQNTLHGTDAQAGQWHALYLAGYLPSFLLFGVLCRRFRLRTLLFWGTIAALPMMFPLLAISRMSIALMVAAPMGLLGGVAAPAILDLIIRSSPRGLQGTVLMASAGLLAIDQQLGNMLGTALYDKFHDFTVCVVAMTVTNGLILPVMLLVPRRLMATADGEAAPAG
ncbi:MAG TPA: MFS transporter [Caulobacteraceae bacterium]|nr:MFS transporter [Caulobacteraceae bacterium]